MERFELSDPWFLLLLIPWLLMVYFHYFRGLKNSGAAVALPSEAVVKRRENFRTKTYPHLPVPRLFALLLIIAALAGPGRGIDYSSVKNRGIDIMIALDLSGSMRGEDFQPKNRLTVAKQVVASFVSKRKTDRIGLVVFAGDAYLQCPLTVEHGLVREIVEELDFDTVSEDGTAVGDALALAASRMMDSEAKSRIILLITDGMSNRGTIDPETAADTCREMGIRVYSVGIGKNGRVPFPNPGGVFGTRYLMNHFNGQSLEKVSSVTGGKYYRAESDGVFWENIKDIDRLERSEVKLKVYHEFQSSASGFLIAAVCLFMLEIFLRSLVYRKIP